MTGKKEVKCLRKSDLIWVHGGFELTVVELAGFYCNTIVLLRAVILETPTFLHCYCNSSIVCYIWIRYHASYHSLDSVILRCLFRYLMATTFSAFFFFIAGSTSRRNKGNPVFLLVSRAGKMRLPCLLGSPTLSRETKMLHFLQASQVHMRSRKLGMPVRFSARCRPLNYTKLHCLLTRT